MGARGASNHRAASIPAPLPAPGATLTPTRPTAPPPAGWIFIILSISGLRGGLLTLVPRSTMLATAGGIGLFLAFIG